MILTPLFNGIVLYVVECYWCEMSLPSMAVGNRGRGGGDHPPPADFGRSLNHISIIGADMATKLLVVPTPLGFLDLPTALINHELR